MLWHDRIDLLPRYIWQEKTSDILIQMHQFNQDSRNSKTIIEPQSWTFVSDNLDYTERENQLCHTTQNERWKVEEGSELSIDAAEHISDRLCRAALLVRNLRYNRNNSRSDLSNYASSTSSSVKESKVTTNPLNVQFTHTQQKKIHQVGVDFSYCWLNLEEQLYSLEQYIGCFWRLAFIHYCGLHQVWLETEN